MNILIISTDPKGKGGVASLVSMQMVTLKKTYQMYHLATHHSGDRSYLKKIIRPLISLIKLPWILIKNNIDIIHIHGSTSGSFPRKIPFLLFAKLLRKKIIYHIHSGKADTYFIKNNLSRKFLNLYDAIIVIGNCWLPAIKTIVEKPVYSILNAVSPPEIPASIKRKRFTVFFIGDTSRDKGLYDLLKIASTISKDDIEFRIAGGGGDYNQLKALCSEQGLDNRVTWLGWIEPGQRDQELANADLFFLPSYIEAMPMAIIEAMFAGLPVLSTPVGSIPDCVIDGETGYLLRAGDVQGFADKIQTLQSDRNLCVTLGQASLNRAQQFFSPDRFAREVVHVYESIFSEPSERTGHRVNQS